MIKSKRTIQSKITRAMLITSTTVLSLTIFTFIAFEYYTFRQNTVERMSVLGAVLADASTAALAFDSKEEANDILHALRAQEHIVGAALYDSEGEIFSEYLKKNGKVPIFRKPGEDGFDFQDSYLHGFYPVILGETRIGTLYLRYDMQVLNKQLGLMGLAALCIFTFSLLIAWLISSQIQKGISKPIVALADVARSVSQRKDYTVRATKVTNDEIGLLTEAFNKMLLQIEKQNLALQESEKKFRTLADNIPNLCWMADANGSINWYNSRWYEYTGTTEDQMTGWGWQSVHHPDHLPWVSEMWKNSLDNFAPFEMVFPLKGADGAYKSFLTKVVPIYEDGKVIQWFGTNTDITEVIKAEEALRLSEEFSRTLLENSPDSVTALDLNGNLLSMNARGFSMLDKEDTEDVLGTRWSDLWPGQYNENAVQALQEAKNGKIAHFQAYTPTLKGNAKWWDVLVAPVYGAEEKVERLVAVSRDVTKLKELEQQKDDFLGIASHELKTPVTSIKAYTQILQTRLQKGNDDVAVNMLAKMDAQLDRLTKLITNLLDVTKIDQGKLEYQNEYFDFAELVEEVVEEVQRTSHGHQVVKLKLISVTVFGDRDRIGQVITNLLTNAIKYSPKADKVYINAEVNDQSSLTFFVKDEGLGLSQQDKEKVFERFYRVKEPGLETYPGLGLGLFISAGIIERHNGKIWVESEKGRGSTFYFTLPLNKEISSKSFDGRTIVG